MQSVTCFLLQPTGVQAEYLRRYCDGENEKCPGRYGYHNGMFHIGNNPESVRTDQPDHSHANWPKKCDHCNYQFKESDHWQVFRENLFKRSDTGEVLTLGNAPAGAMWLASWMPEGFGSVHFKALPEETRRKGHVILKCPGGHDWDIDSNSTNGDGWSRSGEPPNITARPSILFPVPNGYHGFLTGGVLTPC